MKTGFRISSVRGRAFLAIIVIAFVGELVGGLIVSRVVEKQIRQNYEVAKGATVESLSYSLPPMLESYDYEHIELLITAILKHRYIASIAVYANSGTLIRSVKEGTVAPTTIHSETYALSSDGGATGSLEIGFYTGYISDQARATTLALVFGLAGVFVLAVLLLLTRFDRLVSQPLSVLNKRVTEMTPEDLTARIELTREDEFGTLAKNINEMAERLQKHDASRKEVVGELRESQEKLYRIFSSITDGIVVLGLNGTITDVNDATLKLGRFDSADIIVGRSSLEIFDPNDRDRALAGMQEAARSGSVGTGEYVLIRADGSQYPAEVTANVLKDAKGFTVGFVSTIRDITERKRTEEMLRQSEERFRIVFEYAPDAYYLSDLEGNFIDGNKAAERLSGHKKEELIGKSFLKLNMLLPQDIPRAVEALMKDASGQPTGPDEFSLIRKDGSQAVIEISTFPVEIHGRALVLAIARDITERKQAEGALRQSEERYRTILTEMEDSYFEVDLGGHLTFVNSALCRNLGYTREELIGVSYKCLTAEDDIESVFRVFNEVYRTATPNKGFPWKIIRKDGIQGFAETAVSPLRSDNGEIIGFRGVGRDITERKQVEETLRKSKEFSDSLITSMQDGFSVLDPNGVHIDVNPAFCKMTGFSKEELVGVGPPHPYWPPEEYEEIEKIFQKTLKGEFGDVELTFMRKNGERFPSIISPSWTKDDRGNAISYFAGVKDITERKKMEEQLIITDRLASIGELASGIAHELNNPLTGVIGLSQLLVERDIPEEIKEDLKLVNSEAQRAASVVRGLLAFARKHPPAKQLVNVNDVIGKVLDLRAYEQRVSNIERVTNLAPDLPEISADYFQLQQVILNIVTNAEHFMIEAHNKGTLTITTRRVKDKVRISFTDDGQGITEKDLGHVFDPFFTTKEVGKGTGLGLSISHGIVTAHGGRIYAQSEHDNGATFIVELPIKQEEGSDEKQQKK